MTNEKIGIGIVTCDRKDFLYELVVSLNSKYFDYLAVVNDGKESDIFNIDIIDYYHHNEKNIGVGKSKNILFKKLLDEGCDHIFIIEDDLIIKDNNIFKKYIQTSKISGLKHLMFGYHGPANKYHGAPDSRFCVPYNKDWSINVAFNRHCVGAFCYYHRSVLEDVGLNDEEFLNAWEHVEHSYRIVKAGYLPGYWFWPDVKDSVNYIDEQACSEDNSTIRPRKDWNENIIKGAHHFKEKHGYLPVGVPDKDKTEIYNSIKQIREKFGTND